MALITGGLGGLGILAARELGAAGCGLIVTTSRSGRMADTRPEIQEIIETMQQSSFHMKAKCDGADTSAFCDLIAHVQKPCGHIDQTDPSESFAEIMAGLQAAVQSGHMFSQSDIDELEAVKDDFLRSQARLQARLDDKYSEADHRTCAEVTDKAEQVQKMIAYIKESGQIES
mmetsp:Transcript_46391/g.110501  ORF Transcript_46391/g.110501 Transcript_46391/m.110501 type:complete len:173 (-) Transcript_46391:118-636(-)